MGPYAPESTVRYFRFKPAKTVAYFVKTWGGNKIILQKKFLLYKVNGSGTLPKWNIIQPSFTPPKNGTLAIFFNYGENNPLYSGHTNDGTVACWLCGIALLKYLLTPTSTCQHLLCAESSNTQQYTAKCTRRHFNTSTATCPWLSLQSINSWN